MNEKIGGIVPPVVTPLKEDRTFDIESYERLIEHLIAGGVHGLFVLGSSSEVVFSTDDRRTEIVRAAVRFARGRIPVLVGAIDTETNRVKEHIKHAVDEGADAVVATAPFYALQTMTEVERHFELLAEASPIPVWAYDIPVCVHLKLPNDLLMRLGKEGVLAGVKDSSGDDVSFRQLAIDNRDAGHPLTLLTGHEVVVDGAYMSGADGCVPGLGNVDPQGYVRQWNAYQSGDWETVRREQDRLARLMRIVDVKGVAGFGAGIGSFKTALQLLGIFTTNQMPQPVQALEGANVAHVREILEKSGLL